MNELITKVLILISYNISVVLSIIFLKLALPEDITMRSLFYIIGNYFFIIGGLLAVVARMIFIIILKEIANSNLAIGTLISTMAVIFVVIASHLLFKDTLTTKQLCGAVLIITGVFLIGGTQ